MRALDSGSDGAVEEVEDGELPAPPKEGKVAASGCAAIELAVTTATSQVVACDNKPVAKLTGLPPGTWRGASRCR
jgi:hypothetical protein